MAPLTDNVALLPEIVGVVDEVEVRSGRVELDFSRLYPGVLAVP